MRGYFSKDRLKQLRIECGYSAEDLAKRLSVNKTTIYRYEKGEVVPSSRTIRVLAEILHTSEAYLMCLEDSAAPMEGPEAEVASRMGLGTAELQELIYAFRKMNTEGKTEAIHRIQELAELRKYSGSKHSEKSD